MNGEEYTEDILILEAGKTYIIEHILSYDVKDVVDFFDFRF